MKKYTYKNISYTSIAIGLNFILGTIVTYTNVPFLFLDSVGTIFISTTLTMRYGILTAAGTHLLLSLFHGPFALPFMLVSISIAIITNKLKYFFSSYYKACILGIIITLISSFVTVPVRLLLYGGFKGVLPSLSNIWLNWLTHTQISTLFSIYLIAVIDSLIDKIFSCFILKYFLDKIPLIEKREERVHE